MPNRIRDLMTAPLTVDYIKRRTDEGWVAAAVEWVQPEPVAQRTETLDEVPFGQRVSADCKHLADDPVETGVLVAIYEKVVAGWRPAKIAEYLNERDYRTRHGDPWTPNTVFDLMPRLIELSPKLQRRPDWPTRRATLEIVT